MKPVRIAILLSASAALLLVVALRLQADRVEKPLPPVLSNLRQVQVVEIKDDTGALALVGTFTTRNDTPLEIQRRAQLTGTAGSGVAEIAISISNGEVTRQEFEAEMERLVPSKGYRLFVDNKEVLPFDTDEKGGASIRLSTEIAEPINPDLPPRALR